MKNYQVTMVNPQQIVHKGLKGCSSTRTVMTFAQKYGVPCVWWSPNRNQKVLLVDWPQFKTTWNQVWSGQWTPISGWNGGTFSGKGYTTGYRTPSRTSTGWNRTSSYKSGSKTYGKTYGKSTRSRTTGKSTNRTSFRTTTRRTRRAA